MEQMSFGTKNAIAILTKVLLAKPGAWVCIEEPETHLHPQAQQQLLAFLKLEARRKRILVATHSTAFAAATPLGSLYLVERDAANCTAASAVTEKEAARVIHQLGVLSAYDFAAEAVVFVPEADDLPLFTAWAAAAGLAGKVQFLDSEDGHTLQFFANTRVASSERVQTLVYAVFGASPVQDAAAREVRERIVNRLALPAGHAVILDVAEPETYLFEAKALLRACGNLKVTEPDLEQRLVSCRGEPGAKPVLRELLSSLRAGVYDAEVGGRIAAAMDAVPAPVSRLFADIAAQTQPFADI
jgi:hypothetical protein